MAFPVAYFKPQHLPDPALRKHPGDLKLAQFAHLNTLVDQFNLVLPSAPELLVRKDAINGYVGLTGRQINFWDITSTYKSTMRNANTAVRTYTFPDVTGTLESIANKDTTGGYVGRTGLDINFINVAGTFTSLLTNANTAVRTYTFQNRSGTIADDTDLALKANLASPTFTGVPAVPTAAVGTNTTQAASTAFVIAEMAAAKTYLPLLQASGSLTDGDVAGTYSLGNGEAAVVSGGNNATPIQLVYINAAQFASIAGTARTMRLSVILSANDVAPTGDFTFGLYPVTRPGTSGGAGMNIYTLGTVVPGSTAGFATPAADSTASAIGTPFAIPATGFYAIGVLTTTTVDTSAHVHLNARLEVESV